ncbi:MAG: hypothetical protein H3C35_13375 [Bacteroidetes bacterium]|nr:hypothetical protein [Bacteroidota bacterium]
MNNKTAKFLFCENPIADQSDGRQFIFHNREPRLLAEVFSFENISDEKILEIQRQSDVGSRLDYGVETIFFFPIWIEKTEILDAQKYSDNLAGIMRRMADWYQAYLIWEDSQDHDFTEEEF